MSTHVSAGNLGLADGVEALVRGRVRILSLRCCTWQFRVYEFQVRDIGLTNRRYAFMCRPFWLEASRYFVQVVSFFTMVACFCCRRRCNCHGSRAVGFPTALAVTEEEDEEEEEETQ